MVGVTPVTGLPRLATANGWRERVGRVGNSAAYSCARARAPATERESSLLTVYWKCAAVPRRARIRDSCITQLKAQGPSRTCTESKEEGWVVPPPHFDSVPGHQLSRKDQIDQSHFSDPPCYRGEFASLQLKKSLILRKNQLLAGMTNWSVCEGEWYRSPTSTRPGARVAQPLYRNVQWFRGGLVFEAHRLVYHSTLGLRAIKTKKTRWVVPLPNFDSVPGHALLAM